MKIVLQILVRRAESWLGKFEALKLSYPSQIYHYLMFVVLSKPICDTIVVQKMFVNAGVGFWFLCATERFFSLFSKDPFFVRKPVFHYKAYMSTQIIMSNFGP
jgi:hypothetical protein